MDLKSATGSVLGPVFTFVIFSTNRRDILSKQVHGDGRCLFSVLFNLVTRRLALSYRHFTILRFTD